MALMLFLETSARSDNCCWVRPADLRATSRLFSSQVHSRRPLSLLKLFDGVSQFLAGIGVEVARDHGTDTDGAY